MIKVYGNGSKNGAPVIHSSANKATDNIRRIRPTCGQRARVNFTVVTSAEFVVNCDKCLGH